MNKVYLFFVLLLVSLISISAAKACVMASTDYHQSITTDGEPMVVPLASALMSPQSDFNLRPSGRLTDTASASPLPERLFGGMLALYTNKRQVAVGSLGVFQGTQPPSDFNLRPSGRLTDTASASPLPERLLDGMIALNDHKRPVAIGSIGAFQGTRCLGITLSPSATSSATSMISINYLSGGYYA